MGTDLIFMVILKAVATWLHQRSGNIDGSLVRQLCVGSVTGAIAGLIVIVILHWIAGSFVNTVIIQFLMVVLITISIPLRLN